MVKLRTGDSWMPAPEYGHSLKGLTINLLVNSIEKAVAFQSNVLRTEIVYKDPDIAVVKGYGGEWMLHADHTYEAHPLHGLVVDISERGRGIEIRLHGCDPDQAFERAKDYGYEVLTAPTDKEAHGLRETHLIDADGYVWVADVHIR